MKMSDALMKALMNNLSNENSNLDAVINEFNSHKDLFKCTKKELSIKTVENVKSKLEKMISDCEHLIEILK